MPIVHHPPAPVEANRDLSALAATINDLDAAAKRSAADAIEKARQCGRFLLEAKQQVGHGNFEKWRADNCTISARSARRYMMVARGWEKHLAGKTDIVADLPLAGVVKLLCRLQREAKATVRYVPVTPELCESINAEIRTRAAAAAIVPAPETPADTLDMEHLDRLNKRLIENDNGQLTHKQSLKIAVELVAATKKAAGHGRTKGQMRITSLYQSGTAELGYIFSRVEEYAFPSGRDEQPELTARARKLLAHVAAELDSMETIAR